MILFRVDTTFTIPEGEFSYSEFVKHVEDAIDILSEKSNRNVDIDDIKIEVIGNQVNVYYDVHA